MNRKGKTLQKGLSSVKGTVVKEFRKFTIFSVLLITVFAISNPVFARTTNGSDNSSLGKADTSPETASPSALPILDDAPTATPSEPEATATEILATQIPDLTETAEPPAATEIPTETAEPPIATAIPTSTSSTGDVDTLGLPGKPVLTTATMQPKNGALVNTLTPLFTWGASNPAAAYYHLQVSTSSSFSTTVINQSNILNTSFTPASALAPGLRYYWRVQGVNADGAAGSYASTHYFQTPLSAPVLVKPAPATALLTDRPDFDWQDVPGATQYAIQIASSNKFSTLMMSTGVATSSFTPTSDLSQNRLLYWRVQAKTTRVSSPWSEVRSFTSGNPPSVPTLSKPANKAITSDYTPLFDWSSSTVPTGVTFDHYQLQVATDALFTTLAINNSVAGISNSTFTPTTNLASNGLFYWRVRSYSTAGHYSGWSSIYTFRTTILPPTLTLPAAGGVVTSLRPTLDWADVSGAATYTIQVSRNNAFSSLVVNKSVTISQYIFTSDLPQNTRLYWRVMTKTAYVSSIWSEVRTFSVVLDNPPSVPSLVKPANTAHTTDYTPLFDWTDSTVPTGITFDHYQIQVASDTQFSAPVIDEDVAGITNSTYTPTTDLAVGATFYWRVRSYSSTGKSSNWSSVFTFSTVSSVGERPLKYYLADRVINTSDFSKLAGWGINTAMVDFDVNGSSTAWSKVFTEAAKYGISIVIWPSDWNNPRPHCDWEAPFPVSPQGDITKIKPLLDVASTYSNFIGVVNGHESFWTCTNMTFDEMAGLKSKLKAYALSKGRDIKIWNYINSLYDTQMLPDNQISRIMDVAVTWKHCAGGAEGPCDGAHSALSQITSDRARLTSAGLDNVVDLVYIIQTFTTSGGYNTKFTLSQLEKYSCEDIDTNGLDGFGYYTWDAGWWPDLHSWTELQPAIPYVITPGNCR